LADDTIDVTHVTPLHLWVCEYAAVNGDGTCSLLRGGIERISTASLPVNFIAWLYVEVEPGTLDEGTHAVKAVLTTASGVRVFDVNGNLKITAATQRSRFTMPIGANIQSWGEGEVRVTVADCSARRTVTFDRLEAGS